MSGATAVLRLAPVRRYLASVAFAAVGLNILITVLFKQVFDLTGDALDIAWIGLAQFVPAVLLVLVSGWVADRFDRRLVTSLSLAGRVACVVALIVYTQAATDLVWPVFVIAFVLGTADAMLAPARRSIAPLIVEPAQFSHVVAIWTATFTGASIVGPVLGGFLLYEYGVTTSYVVAGVLEVAAIVPILAVKYVRTPERMTERPTLAIAMEGLHFVFRSPIVLATISLDLFAVLFGGAVALIAPVADERLGVGDLGYGWLRAAPGIGAALMAVWIAVRPIERRVGPTLLLVVFLFGLGTVAFGLTTNYAVAFLALVVLSAADMVSMYIRGSLVPLVTPPEQLGRVSAVEGVFIGASNELGAFESGVAARAFGLSWAIAGGGLITMGIAVSFTWLFPSLRKIDTFDDVRPDEPAPVV